MTSISRGCGQCGGAVAGTVVGLVVGFAAVCGVTLWAHKIQQGKGKVNPYGSNALPAWQQTLVTLVKRAYNAFYDAGRFKMFWVTYQV